MAGTDITQIEYDRFKWNVYTEMLDMLDRKSGDEAFQSRFVRSEERTLLGSRAGVDSTSNFPYLEMYIDLNHERCTVEGTTVHELSHQVLRHYDEEFVESASYDLLEEVVQKFEHYYLEHSKYLGKIDIREDLIDEMLESNEYFWRGKDLEDIIS